MTISAYCRMAGINLMAICKNSNKSMKALNAIYMNSPWEFEQFAHRWGNV